MRTDVDMLCNLVTANIILYVFAMRVTQDFLDDFFSPHRSVDGLSNVPMRLGQFDKNERNKEKWEHLLCHRSLARIFRAFEICLSVIKPYCAQDLDKCFNTHPCPSHWILCRNQCQWLFCGHMTFDRIVSPHLCDFLVSLCLWNLIYFNNHHMK